MTGSALVLLLLTILPQLLKADENMGHEQALNERAVNHKINAQIVGQVKDITVSSEAGHILGKTPFNFVHNESEERVFILKKAGFEDLKLYIPKGIGREIYTINMKKLKLPKAEVAKEANLLFKTKINEVTKELLLIQNFIFHQNFSEAKTRLLLFEEKNPGLISTFILLAQAELGLGNKIKAIDHLNKAVSIDPNDITAKRMISFINGEVTQ